MDYVKLYVSKRYNIFILLLLLVLVFCVYHKSLGLTLYGDDWLVISKHLGAYGVGKGQSYWHSSMWFSNYAYQKLIAYLYLIFRFNFLPYFIVSLLLRVFVAYSIYRFVSIGFSNRQALISAVFFTLTVVGAETTDWVYNLNSYLGIGIALIGLSYFIRRTKRSPVGWGLVILGYVIVPIRLFILTSLMPSIYFIETMVQRQRFNFSFFVRVVWKCFIAAVPFLALRFIFPYLGWQKVNSELIGAGLASAKNLLDQSRIDFLLTPFTNLGNMILPYGIKQLEISGWNIYPLGNFIIYGSTIWTVGGLILTATCGVKRNWCVIKPFLLSGAILMMLKIFVRLQGEWLLKDFSYFTWTYFGLIVVTILIDKLKIYFTKNDTKRIVYFVIVCFFMGSFIYPWMYQPGHIFAPYDRYLILPGVGLSLLIGSVFDFTHPIRKMRIVYLTILLCLSLLQVIAVQLYFNKQLEGRNPTIYKQIFGQIKKDIPRLDTASPSLFFFNDFPPDIYESLLRFGFGYHMQLLYNYPFDEEKHPMSVDNLSELERVVKTYEIKTDNIFVYRWKDNNITKVSK